MGELGEVLEGSEGLGGMEDMDEMGNLGDDVSPEEKADIKDVQDEISDNYKNFSDEEISAINESTPEDIKTQVDDELSKGEVKTSVELDSDQSDIAKDADEDPQKPTKNLKAKLQSIWSQYGDFIKSAGQFAAEGVGAYFKFKFILDLVNIGQKDIETLLKVLDGVKDLTPEQKAAVEKLKGALKFMGLVNKVTSKIDSALKVVTTSSVTTSDSPSDPTGIANLMVNTFTFADGRDIIEKGAKLLTSGSTVLSDNYKAFKALNLPQGTPTQAQILEAAGNTDTALSNLNLKDLESFVTNATAYSTEADVVTKKIPDTDKKTKAKLKAALSLPPNYNKSFSGLETIVKAANTKAAANLRNAQTKK